LTRGSGTRGEERIREERMDYQDRKSQGRWIRKTIR